MNFEIIFPLSKKSLHTDTYNQPGTTASAHNSLLVLTLLDTLQDTASAWAVFLLEAPMGIREKGGFCFFDQDHWSWRNHHSLFQTYVNNTSKIIVQASQF